MGEIRSIRDLEVYRLAFEAAMEVYRATLSFPREELYSLTDQVRRSSRSVAGNIREGYTKRRYKGVFRRHLMDSMGSSEETRTWLDFALECGYLPPEVHQRMRPSTTASRA